MAMLLRLRFMVGFQQRTIHLGFRHVSSGYGIIHLSKELMTNLSEVALHFPWVRWGLGVGLRFGFHGVSVVGLLGTFWYAGASHLLSSGVYYFNSSTSRLPFQLPSS